MNTKKTYAGIPEEYAQTDQARIALIPVPYDGTSTWRKGADQGPEAFLAASENMELYDIETGTEVYRQGIWLAPAITENSNPEALVEAVHKRVKEYINRGKFVTLIGGEHSVSIGSIRAFNECFDNLTVLQIDAHADLRASYQGSSCSHACAMHEAAEFTNLIQVGIRSMDALEKTYMDLEKVFFAHEILTDDFWMEKAIDLMTENVFITFDMDGLDPSIMPSTGTPEPGGLMWYETLEFLRRVFEEKNVVGFDLMELCPNPSDPAPDFLAAKLYYKMLSYRFRENANLDDFEADDIPETGNTRLGSFYSEDDEY
jgi:agmatinase